MLQNNAFHLEEKKRIYFILETSVRKYCYYPFSFLDIQLKAHLSFSFGLFRLGLATGNLRLTFGQFTIQVRNYITTLAPTLPSGEWEITLSVQFLSVFGAVKWCLMRYSSPWPLPSSHASLPPSLLLHFAPPLRNLHCDWWRGMPGEEGTLKDTAKSNCGTSRFLIIVRFKCFCKNVVNLPTLLEAWVPWAGTNIQHIRYVFSCKFNVYWFLFFLFLFPSELGWVSCSSGKRDLITVCYLTWRVLAGVCTTLY